MTADDFFAKVVEGYLFGDLESMAECDGPSDSPYGAVGYPMVATLCAGMELLGGLLMPDGHEFRTREGDVYFLNYWDNYLSVTWPDAAGQGRLMYQLVRHGIAHAAFAKPGIFVNVTSNRAVSRGEYELVIGSRALHRAFRTSYDDHVRPLLGTDDGAVNRKSIQVHLDQMESWYQLQARREFEASPEPGGVPRSALHLGEAGVSGVGPVLPTGEGARTAGQSGALGPIQGVG